MVSDTRAFLALMDTLRARPGSGPAWIYTNDGARFIMAVLILGPALVALCMWLVYVFAGQPTPVLQCQAHMGRCLMLGATGTGFNTLKTWAIAFSVGGVELAMTR